MVRLIIHVRIKEEQVRAFIDRCSSNVAATLREKGCVSNELYQDLDDPCTFHFYEEWETEEDLAAHNQTPQVLETNRIIPGMADGEPTFYSVRRIY